MKRRDFLRCLGLASAGLCFGTMTGPPVWGQDQAPPPTPGPSGVGETDGARFLRPAMHFVKLDHQVVQCRLCPRQCEVADGDRGRCGVRENRGGDYYTLVYGRAVAVNNDPIEKKPFNHFRPGTMILSAAAAGCNLSCKFCQNWQISQFPPEDVAAQFLPPEQMVDLAKANGIPSLAFTYAEPTVFYEYMYETARLGREQDLTTVAVSNGFIQPEAVKQLSPELGAYKVDLKAFSDKFYQDFCGGRLAPVLKTLETLADLGQWVEIVNLVLPTANDHEKDIRAMARWIRENIGPMVPLHFTRFHPMYKIRNLPPTPVATLERCHQAATEEGLKYVYVGNVPGHPQGHTYCHHCGRLLIERTGLWAVNVHLEDGRCPGCRTDIPGVWS
jgi:pyruvate formate lyase activating enzyme